jgi:hypothetical protein
MPFGFDDAIGAIGLLGGLFGGQAEDPNIAIAKDENARRKKLYEMLMGLYQSRKSDGYYDPESRVGQLRTDTSIREGRQLENLAGASRIAGYRPGDSAPERMQESTARGYNYQFNQMANEIRDKVRMQEMQDLNGINNGINPYVTVPDSGPKYGSLLNSASPFLTRLSGGFKDPKKPSGNYYGDKSLTDMGVNLTNPAAPNTGFAQPNYRKKWQTAIQARY